MLLLLGGFVKIMCDDAVEVIQTDATTGMATTASGNATATAHEVFLFPFFFLELCGAL